MPQYLKTTEKITFNIASDASYFYNLRGQKFIKNAKNAPEAGDQRVLPDRLILIGQKLLKIAKNTSETLWVILQAFVFFRWPNPGPKWSNACPMPIIVYLKCHEPFANPFRSPQVDLSIFEECNADRQIASFV